MRVLICADDVGIPLVALHFGVGLTGPGDAPLRILSTRSGPDAAEAPPPLEESILPQDWYALPKGLRVLAQAMTYLVQMGYLQEQNDILIRETHQGFVFSAQTSDGVAVSFFEQYGRIDRVVNQHLGPDPNHLVVVAPPRRKGLEHVFVDDTARRMVVELNASVLVARGGSLQSRFLVCADGSPSAQQLRPVLAELLAVVDACVDLLWVEPPEAKPEEVRAALEFVAGTRQWLAEHGKDGQDILIKSRRPVERILEIAGGDSIIVMGANIHGRDAISKRINLPLRVLSKTESSVLLAKTPLALDPEFAFPESAVT